MTPTLDLDTLTLDKGAHEQGDGMCLLEAVSVFSGEPWSDHPSCVCPVLAAFGRKWNDRLSNAERQQLKQYIPRLPGTNGGHELAMKRGHIAADWAVREVLLSVCKSRPALIKFVEPLQALAPITDKATAIAGHDLAREVRAAYAAAAADAAAAACAAYAAAYAADADAYVADADAYVAAAADAAALRASMHTVFVRMLEAA